MVENLIKIANCLEQMRLYSFASEIDDIIKIAVKKEQEDEIVASNDYVFHMMPKTPNNVKTIKEYGLCSPQKLYDIGDKMFRQTYLRYKDRTAEQLDKKVKDITNEDILKWFDTRKPLNASTIYFSLVHPFGLNQEIQDMFKFDHPHVMVITIERKKLKKYAPYVLTGADIDKRSWSYVNDEDFMKEVRSKSKQPPNKNKFAFSKIPHIGLNCGSIPYEDFDDVETI